MIKKLLVANRGEIALRIIRACRELGIKSVAVYSEADETSLHTRFADQTVCIGPAKSSLSYLNIPAILGAAEITGADAIHPGYGFLAENAKFAQMCAEQNLTFIGPPPEVIARMGNKSMARKAMVEANIPITPGTGILANVKQAQMEAEKIGYPVLLKAVAGGGGKGMRVVPSPSEMEKLFSITSNEALNGFANPDLYMEKYLAKPRHVEIQILGDSYGNIIHLGERDCSIQRRHQKLIEESPSPAISPEVRKRLGDAAVKGAKFVGYQNAGTIEFLFDEETEQFYFMEMNTRIQVEHPVSEMATGINIVREQIRAASGDKLKYRQSDVKFNGAAIECRINAENPLKNWAPSPGKINYVHLPGGFGVRVDTHIYADYMIPHHYDSLLAKLIVWGETREDAIRRMKRSLTEFVVEPLKTSIPFHQMMMDDEGFSSGKFHTKYLDELDLNAKISAHMKINE